MYRAIVGIEKGRLIKSFNWPCLLDAKSGSLHLRLLSPRTKLLRDLFTFPAFLLPISLFFIVWQPINSRLVMGVPTWAYAIWAVVAIPFAFALWILPSIALIYIFDFITLPVQAHFSREVAVLTLKSVQMGRLRHVLQASGSWEGSQLKTTEEEFVLTILATRRSLTGDLRPMIELTQKSPS